MGCSYQPECGGCCFRDKAKEEYAKLKENKVRHILDTALSQKDYVWERPIFWRTDCGGGWRWLSGVKKINLFWGLMKTAAIKSLIANVVLP